jgi:hypothetical protein
MAGTSAPRTARQPPAPHILPARTPGSLGRNDQADPTVVASQGDTPGPAGIGDHYPPRVLRSGPAAQSATPVPYVLTHRYTVEWSGSVDPVLVGIGVPSVARIPVPGTKLFIELSPRGWVPKGGSTSAIFIQDATGKKVLRLDYGYNKTTGTVDYHWNQKGTFSEFGIADHTSAGGAGEALYKSAKVLRYGGRVLLVVGAVLDIYSIVVAKKRLRQVIRVVSGWAGAWAGATALGAAGAEGGSVEPGLGTAVGGVVCGVVGAVGGYFGASWAAGEAYDWVEEEFFEPVPLTDSQ